MRKILRKIIMSSMGNIFKVLMEHRTQRRTKAEMTVCQFALLDFALASITGSACVLYIIVEVLSWTSQSIQREIHSWLHHCSTSRLLSIRESSTHDATTITLDAFSTVTFLVTLLIGFYYLDKYLFFITYDDCNEEKKLAAFQYCFVLKTVTLVALYSIYTLFRIELSHKCQFDDGQLLIGFFQRFTSTGLPFIPLIFLMFYVIEIHLFRLFVTANSEKNLHKTLDWLTLRAILSALGLLFILLFVSLSKIDGFWMTFILFIEIVSLIYKPVEILWAKDYIGELSASASIILPEEKIEFV